MKMDSYTAVSIAEGFCDFTPTAWQELQAWAYLVKTGKAWTLQGWFGRTAQALIDDNLITMNGTITDKGKQYKELAQ